MPRSFIDEKYEIDEGLWTISQVCYVPRRDDPGHAMLILESYTGPYEHGHVIEWYDFIPGPVNPGELSKNISSDSGSYAQGMAIMANEKRAAEIRYCPGSGSRDSRYLVKNITEQIKMQFCRATGLDKREGDNDDYVRCWQRDKFFKERKWDSDKINTWLISAEIARILQGNLRRDMKSAESGDIKFQLRGGG